MYKQGKNKYKIFNISHFVTFIIKNIFKFKSSLIYINDEVILFLKLDSNLYP